MPRGPCLKVRLIRPNGDIALTEEFTSEERAHQRMKRLLAACLKDGWIGARVQCLDSDGNVVKERRIVRPGVPE